MKKLSYGLFILFIGVLTAFKPGNDHGNIITFDDGLTWVWRADNCITADIPALTTRSMVSSKGFHMVDVTFQLPAGHCDIPLQGTSVRRYPNDQWAIIHSDGFVRGKILITPN